MLLDMAALASEAEIIGSMGITIHGDAAAVTLRDWAASRGIEVKASVQRHTVNERDYTVTVDVAHLADQRSITAFGDWHEVGSTDVVASPYNAISAGGAA